MPDRLPPGPPMDLANMRQNGVTALTVTCLVCRHSADVDASSYPGEALVIAFSGRFRCSKCGSNRTDSRPAWHQRPTPEPYLGYHGKHRR